MDQSKLGPARLRSVVEGRLSKPNGNGDRVRLVLRCECVIVMDIVNGVMLCRRDMHLSAQDL